MCICVCLLPIFTLDWICSFMCTHQQLHVHIDSLLSPILPITVSKLQILPGGLYHLYRSLLFSLTHLLSNTFRQHTSQQFRARWTARAEGIKHSHRESFYVSETLFILMNLTSQTVLFYEMSAITSRQCQGEGNVSAPPCWAFSRSGSLQLMTRVWRVLP